MFSKAFYNYFLIIFIFALNIFAGDLNDKKNSEQGLDNKTKPLKRPVLTIAGWDSMKEKLANNSQKNNALNPPEKNEGEKSPNTWTNGTTKLQSTSPGRSGAINRRRFSPSSNIDMPAVNSSQDMPEIEHKIIEESFQNQEIKLIRSPSNSSESSKIISEGESNFELPLMAPRKEYDEDYKISKSDKPNHESPKSTSKRNIFNLISSPGDVPQRASKPKPKRTSQPSTKIRTIKEEQEPNQNNYSRDDIICSILKSKPEEIWLYQFSPEIILNYMLGLTARFSKSELHLNNLEKNELLVTEINTALDVLPNIIKSLEPSCYYKLACIAKILKKDDLGWKILPKLKRSDILIKDSSVLANSITALQLLTYRELKPIHEGANVEKILGPWLDLELKLQSFYLMKLLEAGDKSFDVFMIFFEAAKKMEAMGNFSGSYAIYMVLSSWQDNKTYVFSAYLKGKYELPELHKYHFEISASKKPVIMYPYAFIKRFYDTEKEMRESKKDVEKSIYHLFNQSLFRGFSLNYPRPLDVMEHPSGLSPLVPEYLKDILVNSRYKNGLSKEESISSEEREYCDLLNFFAANQQIKIWEQLLLAGYYTKASLLKLVEHEAITDRKAALLSFLFTIPRKLAHIFLEGNFERESFDSLDIVGVNLNFSPETKERRYPELEEYDVKFSEFFQKINKNFDSREDRRVLKNMFKQLNITNIATLIAEARKRAVGVEGKYLSYTDSLQEKINRMPKETDDDKRKLNIMNKRLKQLKWNDNKAFIYEYISLSSLSDYDIERIQPLLAMLVMIYDSENANTK